MDAITIPYMSIATKMLWMALGGIVSVFLERTITWRKPQLSHQTASQARISLDHAVHIFGQSTATHGRLAHPWNYLGDPIHFEKLENDLSAVRARITDKAFRESVDQVVTELRGVWAAARVSRAAIGYPGRLPTQADDEREQANQHKADAQLAHARAGEQAAKTARNQLGRLERHV